ncbi:DUF190 domain-containing protein [Desulfospira joergensenii]|uniref:DUF190 domain-containing protein n=1 Tax=Desulfospira joergensenii TaxID=53329 RepID=UPI0003B6B698|nr:DUF190 domain-containing protein [Desulfospira joergensenii]
MLNYKSIDIFTNEEARYQSQPVSDAVIEFVQNLKIAARCHVTKGTDGCYENGEVVTRRLEILSFNMPVRIYIILPEAEVERVLPTITEMITDGIVAIHDLKVVSHRARNSFFPRQVRVRDAMTRDPKSVSSASFLDEAAQLLLSSIFTGLPVVDESAKPIGMITQGDLIKRGGMPIRLGFLAESDPKEQDSILTALGRKQAADVMTRPVITIEEDCRLIEAVDLMLKKGTKRLPVVDKAGRLTGILSRLDVFKTVMKEAPDWNTFRAQQVRVENLRYVKDVLRRDLQTVSPETAVWEVIRTIDSNDIQRVAVIDDKKKLLGIISDWDLLRFFKRDQNGVWGLIKKSFFFIHTNTCDDELRECLSGITAATAMNTDLVTVREDALLEEAIGIMTEKALKRLPVVDEQGRFAGMISRDSLLRTGFAGEA